MKYSHAARSSFPGLATCEKQQGVVLIIALVMLLILTLIGVAGLRDTQLQERMAGGAQDREIAFQAAETALRVAEAAITSGQAAANDNGAQYKDYQDPLADAPNLADLQRENAGGDAVTEAVYWRDVYDWKGDGGNNSFVVGDVLASVSDQPLYVIERLPDNYSIVPGTWNETGDETVGTPKIVDYIVTARGVGSTPDAVVILQSQYRVVTYY